MSEPGEQQKPTTLADDLKAESDRLSFKVDALKYRKPHSLVEMMDVICDPNVHEVVVKKSTQIGYSDAVLNAQGLES
jgi:hypothetical protein